MDTRVFYLMIGCVVGFVVGYIVRSLREIKDKVEEVDRHVTHHDDEGFISNDWVNKIALLLVVLLVAFAAIKSQSTSNGLKTQQARSDKVAACTQQYLSKTIVALNERTEFSQEQNTANLALQGAQAKFLLVLKPRTDVKQDPEAGFRALNVYLDALATYIEVASKSSSKVATNPFPTATEFLDCVNAKD